SHGDVRALAACVVWGAFQRPPAAALVQRLPLVRRYLEEHEGKLPVRGVWLCWASLVRLSAGDVLGLARARDRLLERLLDHGLNPQTGLPPFLRFSGQQSSDRFRRVREPVPAIRERARRWIRASYGGSDGPPASFSLAYADLMFAFGLARLGESTESRQL